MNWDFDIRRNARPLWLTTLADLSLLLVGFFVFLQINKTTDPAKLAEAFRSGFGAREAAAPAMPLELATVTGFAPGSARVADAASAITWAREAARDPRTRLRIVGEVDGTTADVDPATGSGPILAADRARAVAAALVGAGAAAPGRIEIGTATGQRRAVITAGFVGERK
ncbi:flagellar motor protein MotB [Sphingomonas canadensis]|uniref:Flagellar motor protein MotB n=1 Tax=Sphingomonas canadensis TaxID=1219257 RepID=A0ABW3H1C0_9SPHN|nr:flagellar motor protein MotB [Sphingomonas canadensis]MCW3834839.1 flagellar motor protein MotB [Sphingomonas canadensis]